MLNVSFVFAGYENGRPYWTSTQYGMKIVWTGLYWEILYWPYDGLPVNYTDTDIPLTGWQLIFNTSLTATFSVNLGECCFVYSYLNDVLDSTLTIKYIDCNYTSQNITAEYGTSGSFCAVSIEFSNNTGSYSLTGDLCPPEPSPSITPSISITPSTTPSISISKTPSVTPSITPSVTPSISINATPSITPSTTPSTTPSISISVTPSITPSVTPSISISATPSVTPSITPSATPFPPFAECLEYDATGGLGFIYWTDCDGSPQSYEYAGGPAYNFCALEGSISTTGSIDITLIGDCAAICSNFTLASLFEQNINFDYINCLGASQSITLNNNSTIVCAQSVTSPAQPSNQWSITIGDFC